MTLVRHLNKLSGRSIKNYGYKYVFRTLGQTTYKPRKNNCRGTW